MAHEILIENGKPAMFYALGDVPRHHLGTQMDEPPSWNEVTS